MAESGDGGIFRTIWCKGGIVVVVDLCAMSTRIMPSQAVYLRLLKILGTHNQVRRRRARQVAISIFAT